MTDGARAGATDHGTNQQVTPRFGLLDALRGVAALVVLAYHLVQQHSLSALPHAGLAVDFFYTLSGFVIGLDLTKEFSEFCIQFRVGQAVLDGVSPR